MQTESIMSSSDSDKDHNSRTAGSKLMQCYEAIEQVSGEMLQAARGGDWDRVVTLEGACVILIAKLKQTARKMNMSGDERRHKTQIMKRILVNDAEIRALAEPEIDELGRMIFGGSKSLIH